MADECIPIMVVRALREAMKKLKVKATIEHLPEWLSRFSVDDAEWAPTVKSSGRWVVLTADGARQSTYQPLPKVLMQHEISAVYLSRTMQQQLQWRKFRVIVGAWHAIEYIGAKRTTSRCQLFFDDHHNVCCGPFPSDEVAVQKNLPFRS